MSEVAIGAGTCLAFGGTNARVGQLVGGEIAHFDFEATPTDPTDFANWMARQTLAASDRGHEWVVAGFPGPVSTDGRLVGPMVNINGMKHESYDLNAEMTAVEPAFGRLLEDEHFRFVKVNDGPLAAQAVAIRMAREHHNAVCAIPVGTGNGEGIVFRDPALPSVFRDDAKIPGEIGHIMLSDDPFDTYEHAISGPGLSTFYNGSSREFTEDHPAAKKAGRMLAREALLMGLMLGADLVVPTGGVGAGASSRYAPHLSQALEDIRRYGNAAQKKFLPEVALVLPEEADRFEIYGALGVMADVMTRTEMAA